MKTLQRFAALSPNAGCAALTVRLNRNESGYDFISKGMSYTTVDIYRDLHCWEMRFSWVPFGYYRSWFFQINIKADALHDVKYEKRQNYQENNGYYSY